ncbi:MAG TPA: hypothetical protein VF789_21750 [Thermoanaerobaculia bacterium]
MCVIVDANLASQVFGSPAGADFTPLIDWLQESDGELVVGGYLATELGRMAEPRRFLIALLRAGKARQLPEAAVLAEEQRVDETGLCRSNDRHVIALARVSGARTLCTLDRDLQRDFGNAQLVSNPRGKIYQRQEHAHLLKHTRSCGKLPKKR